MPCPRCPCPDCTRYPKPADTAIDVVGRVAKAFGVSLVSVIGAERHARVTFARHVAMFALRERFQFSYPELGRIFGRDHTSVIAGVRRIDAMTSLVVKGATIERRAFIDGCIVGEVSNVAAH